MKEPRRAQGWGLLALAATGSVLLVARFVPAVVSFLPACPWRSLTGLPCPTCGSTRALMALAGGDFQGALGHQPLVTIAALTVICWGFSSLLALTLKLPAPTFRLDPIRQIKAARVIGALALLNWVYLLAATLLT